MAVLSQTYGYLFIQTPRTGCTAIADGVLRPLLGGIDIPPNDVYDESGRLVIMRKHCKLADLLRHGYLSTEEADRLLKFAAVRNPFDSLVSLYVKMRDEYPLALNDPNSWVGKDPAFVAAIHVAMNHSFPEWVEYRFGEPAIKRMVSGVRRLGRHSNRGHDQGMDVVMRFESLQDDFNRALGLLGLEEIEIPRINPTSGRERDYKAYYTPRARRIVERAHRRMLDRYGYTF